MACVCVCVCAYGVCVCVCVFAYGVCVCVCVHMACVCERERKSGRKGEKKRKGGRERCVFSVTELLMLIITETDLLKLVKLES